MKNVLTIAGRELRSFFVSPIAYVVLTGYLLLAGWFFFNLLARFNLLVSMYSSFQGQGMGDAVARLNLNEFVMAPLLHNLAVILLIVIPMITMRSASPDVVQRKASGVMDPTSCTYSAPATPAIAPATTNAVSL